MKFFTASRTTSFSELPGGTCALISITDPGVQHPQFFPERFVEVLQLSFFDIEEPMVGLRCASPADAQQIWEFVEAVRNKRGIDSLVVQCDRGIGRSVGIVSALKKLFTGDDSFGAGMKPNRLVEQLVLDAAARSPAGERGEITIPVHQPDKVSICVRVKYPVNRLQAMLLCLQRQTYRNWEALIVTDGPNPHAKLLVSSFEDDRLVFLETDNPLGFWGHPYRDFGILNCTGSLIGLTNDDNYYVPGYFDQMVHHLKRHDADLVLCDMLHAGLGWDAIHTSPVVCGCDLGNWLVKAEIAKGTPWPGNDAYDDGRYVEALAQKGKVAILRRILFVKN